MSGAPNLRFPGVDRKETQARSPAWIITFADLNSLLLAFFMLLFAFSEQDKAKFKEIADSMRGAFGIPPIIYEKPPEPTSYAKEDPQHADKENLTKALKSEIDAGLIELAQDGDRIVIRIKEKGVFPSGSNRLEPSFEPIMRRLANTLAGTNGTIVVAGHTDSIPIANSVFSSNWQLSTARALAVAQVFFDGSDILANRVHLESYAEFKPIDSNDTPEGRARNRRVEISLIHAPPPPPPPQPRVQEPTTQQPEAPHTEAALPPQRTPAAPVPAVKADPSAARKGPDGAKGVAPATEAPR